MYQDGDEAEYQLDEGLRNKDRLGMGELKRCHVHQI